MDLTPLRVTRTERLEHAVVDLQHVGALDRHEVLGEMPHRCDRRRVIASGGELVVAQVGQARGAMTPGASMNSST